MEENVNHWTRAIAIALALNALAGSCIYAQTQHYMDIRNAGRAEYRAGHFAAAEELLRNALIAASNAHDDAGIGTIQNDFGDVYVGEERLRDAEQSYVRAMEIFKKLQGKEFELAATLRNIGSVYSLQRRDDDALKILNQASKLPIFRNPAKDPRLPSLTAEILNSKGIVLVRQGSLGKARTLFEEAIRTRSAAGIDGGVGDAQTWSNIGTIYLKQKRYALAEQPLLRSIEITERILGPSHPDLVLTLANLGEVYTQIGRYAEAMNQYDRCLAILRNSKPTLDGRIARILQLVSTTHLKQGDKASAEKALADAVDLARHTSVIDDPSVPDMFDGYANLLKQVGKTEQARQIHAEAQRMRAALALTVRVPVKE